jgi:hypothetical protein
MLRPRTATPPALMVSVEFEGPVTLICSAQTKDEQIRLTDWLNSSPERRELVCLAIDLEHEPEPAS